MKLNKEKIEMLRAEKCLTKMDVIQKAQTSSQTLYRALNGEDVDAAVIGKFAKALNVPVQDIIIQEERS